MALSRIPLPHFTDRTNRRLPKGLMTPTGLVSAMRNPMYATYSEQMLVDFRPRDNWTVSAQREDVRQAELKVLAGVNGKLIVDEEGAYLGDPQTPTTDKSVMEVINDYSNGLFQLDVGATNPPIAVALIAIKVLSITPPTGTIAGARFGYQKGAGLSQMSVGASIMEAVGSNYKARLYSVRAATYENPFPSAGADTLTSASVGKWILVQFVKEANSSAIMRVLGGQFGSGSTPDSLTKTAQGSGSWETDRFWVPLREKEQAKLGFATLAQYEIGPGTGAGLITWTLFDAEHECQPYVVDGTRIRFSCSNGVSWDVREKTSGTWYRLVSASPVTWATSGSRHFFNGASNQDLDFTQDAGLSAIKPILQNTGALNSEVLGRLTSASAGVP